jgi:hypothetical protein
VDEKKKREIMIELKVGDQVLINATREELNDIGVCSEHSFEFLLNGEAKTVYEVHKDLIYVRPPKEAMLWVKRSMVQKI